MPSRSSPGRTIRKFICKSEVKSSPVTRIRPTKGTGSPTYKHSLRKTATPAHVNENKFTRDLTGRRDLGKKGPIIGKKVSLLLGGLASFHVNTTKIWVNLILQHFLFPVETVGLRDPSHMQQAFPRYTIPKVKDAGIIMPASRRISRKVVWNIWRLTEINGNCCVQIPQQSIFKRKKDRCLKGSWATKFPIKSWHLLWFWCLHFSLRNSGKIIK